MTVRVLTSDSEIHCGARANHRSRRHLSHQSWNIKSHLEYSIKDSLVWQVVSQTGQALTFGLALLKSKRKVKGRSKNKGKDCIDFKTMQKLQISVYIYLFMLIVAGPVDLNENSEQKENVEKEGLCNACLWRENTTSSRLEAIKIQILSKLRLETAPNISKDAIRQLLPKAPPLLELIDQFDVQRDASSDGSLEDDDYHARTETVITMPTECE